MTIEKIRKNNLIILESISGSRAYGLHTETSDVDIKGIFVLPKKDFYGLNYIKQISNETNDIVFFELGRFMELLSVNNPNILELLNTPDDSIVFKSDIFKQIDNERVLSKLCKDTFGKFAISQIKKAKGLNKKIINPMDKERKKPIDFCYVNYGSGSISLKDYLKIKNLNEKNCGLTKIPHMKYMFGLFYNENGEYSGIVKNDFSTELTLSSIPKDEKPIALLYFNSDGFSSYCKKYREYWDWVEKRNEKRYENTITHGKNYDSKNMMHTFRLLNMAIEIANEKKINVKRNDRDFLLDIKAGKFEYDELLNLAKQKQNEMEIAFEKSDLPEKPDFEYINQITFELREKFYCKHSL